MELKERLRQLREEKDRTQEEVARMTNINIRTYQRYESGEREPTLSILKNFAQYYSVTLDYLAGLTDKKE